MSYWLIIPFLLCSLLSYTVRTVGKRHGLTEVEWFTVYLWLAVVMVAACIYIRNGVK